MSRLLLYYNYRKGKQQNLVKWISELRAGGSLEKQRAVPKVREKRRRFSLLLIAAAGARSSCAGVLLYHTRALFVKGNVAQKSGVFCPEICA
jgi:hypothetical protein